MTACLGEPSHITRLEHAQARLTLSYNRRGDLAIHLVSPMGTRSTLLAARCVPSPLPSPSLPSHPCAFSHSLSQPQRQPNTAPRGIVGVLRGLGFVLWDGPMSQESPVLFAGGDMCMPSCV